jgi:hypothetical protein
MLSFYVKDLDAKLNQPEVWDKWCKNLHSRPLLAPNFIIETSFVCTIFLIYFLQNKYRCISSNPNNISRYFPLIGDEIVDGEGLNYPTRTVRCIADTRFSLIIFFKEKK